MIRKVRKENLFLLKDSELNLEEVLQNEKARAYRGGVEQYVLDAGGKLVGTISGCSVKKNKSQLNGTSDIKSLVDTKPIVLVQTERERAMAEAILEKERDIQSLPVIDREGVFQYAYVRVDRSIREFTKKEQIPTKEEVQKAVKWAEWKAKSMNADCEIKILSDLASYGADLSFLHKQMIDERDLEELDPGRAIVLLAFKNVSNLVEIGENLIQKKLRYVVCNIFNKDIFFESEPYFRLDKEAEAVLSQEADCHGSFFDWKDFQNLCQVIRLTAGLEGDYVEIGTYKGDSARVALSYMNRTGIRRRAYFLDTYEGYSKESIKKSSDCWVDGLFEDSSEELVRRRLDGFANYELIKTDIVKDSLPEKIQQIAICNIDIGIYDAEYAALNKVRGKMAAGGMIVAENFGHAPQSLGSFLAAVRFMKENGHLFHGVYLESGQYLMIKK